MAVVRVRVNPDNVNQIVIDTEDNSSTPFVEKVTHARFSLAATAGWQEFFLTIPEATRAFKIGDIVDLDLTDEGENFHIRCGTTWVRITTGATFGNDSAVRTAGYVFAGNIKALKRADG